MGASCRPGAGGCECPLSRIGNRPEGVDDKQWPRSALLLDWLVGPGDVFTFNVARRLQPLFSNT